MVEANTLGGRGRLISEFQDSQSYMRNPISKQKQTNPPTDKSDIQKVGQSKSKASPTFSLFSQRNLSNSKKILFFQERILTIQAILSTEVMILCDTSHAKCFFNPNS